MTKPRILVGIPTLNGAERLWRCLYSIGETVDFHRHDVRVLVADDGSTDEDLKQNFATVHRAATCCIPGVEMLYGHGRTGIAKAWNRLVRHDPARDIVILLNDDVEVAPDWLDAMVYTLVENPTLGMVGFNTYCGVTKAQVAKERGEPLRIDYSEARVMDGGGALLSSHGPAFGFRRAAYDEVDGFDERYYVFYEEMDFGVALCKRGYRHAMLSYPVLYHMGGATNSDPKNLDAVKHMAESKAKFHEKWGASLAELRQQFRFADDAAYPRGLSRWREWCTQVKVWRD